MSESQSKMEELRSHLFETLKDLRNTEKPLDIERARAISEVAQTLINTAKVEVDFARVTGAKPISNLLPLPSAPTPTKPADRARLVGRG